MPFTRKMTPDKHPLGWGEAELQWLVSRNLNATAIYHAMGYDTDKRPNKSFVDRLEQIRQNLTS